jgi:hypothetical protein
MLHDACQALQEDRFPGAAGAKYGKNAPALDAEIDSIENGVFPEALEELIDLKQW